VAIHHPPATWVGVKAEQGCGVALKWAATSPTNVRESAVVIVIALRLAGRIVLGLINSDTK